MTQQRRKKLTLSLGGSFNPIHTQHVEIMQMAKEHLESRPEMQLEVMEGFMAPSTDSYLLSKMKRKSTANDGKDNEMINFVIKSDHRINMCNLAISKYPWLKPISKCFGSAYECGEQMKSSPDYEVAIVIGADRAKTPYGKYKWQRRFKNPLITVIIGRSDQIKDIRAAWERDLSENLVVNPESYFLVDQADTRGVSSTLVRKEMDFIFKSIDETTAITIDDQYRREKMQKLIETNLLDNRVAEYIFENRNDLLIN